MTTKLHLRRRRHETRLRQLSSRIGVDQPFLQRMDDLLFHGAFADIHKPKVDGRIAVAENVALSIARFSLAETTSDYRSFAEGHGRTKCRGSIGWDPTPPTVPCCFQSASMQTIGIFHPMETPPNRDAEYRYLPETQSGVR